MKALPALCMALVAAPGFADDISRSLNGDLVHLKDKQLVQFDTFKLATTKYYAVYFSAEWCGPCRAFTPSLVTWYNENKPKHPEFELVFVSRDFDQAAMREYMVKDNMPWPALKYSQIRSKKAITKYAGDGIPCLVFMDASGKVLSDSYAGKQYRGPRAVLADMTKTLNSGATPSAPGAPAGVTPAPTKEPPRSSMGSNFDEFFKKK